MNVITITPRPAPLTAALLAGAREAAEWHETQGRSGTAATIFNLVSEIEALREAAKGQLVIVQEASRIASLAQLKASVLLMIAEKLQPVIDQEIEQRQAGGNVESWASLAALSNELHAAIWLAKG